MYRERVAAILRDGAVDGRLSQALADAFSVSENGMHGEALAAEADATLTDSNCDTKPNMYRERVAAILRDGAVDGRLSQALTDAFSVSENGMHQIVAEASEDMAAADMKNAFRTALVARRVEQKETLNELVESMAAAGDSELHDFALGLDVGDARRLEQILRQTAQDNQHTRNLIGTAPAEATTNGKLESMGSQEFRTLPGTELAMTATNGLTKSHDSLTSIIADLESENKSFQAGNAELQKSIDMAMKDDQGQREAQCEPVLTMRDVAQLIDAKMDERLDKVSKSISQDFDEKINRLIACLNLPTLIPNSNPALNGNSVA
jgi:hypothetical protein